ncbi:MAG: DUF4347 domain-containing protein [Oculatellaceae cyanobacterium bins.114]|nr:DUF4347 domain-containing protein [Oculatellaceae cyanobacterium bins.114]
MPVLQGVDRHATSIQARLNTIIHLAANYDRPSSLSIRSPRPLVCIDRTVPDYYKLVNGTVSDCDIALLDSREDGILQITNALRHYQSVTVLHLVSHGKPGRLYLGNNELNETTIEYYADALRQWSNLLAPEAMILVYGCSVAAEDTTLLHRLHELTGRAIAASSTPTGDAAQGGNWDLDVVIGADAIADTDAIDSSTDAIDSSTDAIDFSTDAINRVSSPFTTINRVSIPSPFITDAINRVSSPFTPETLATYRGLLAIFTVTNTNDTGTGSLRQAILDANAAGGADEIRFNIAGAGPHTITPSTALPTITGQVTIDGTTQPGFAGSPLIVISGSSIPTGTGLSLSTSSSTIRGLVVNGFSGSGGRGISIAGSDNVIEGNIIGLAADGTTVAANAQGIDISSGNNNLIGGTTASARNIISGNSGVGIRVFDATATTIQGNYIGTDVNGNEDRGNLFGIQLNSSLTSPGLTIGGTTAAARNVISGNGTGIVLLNGNSSTIAGNYIGVNAAGTTAVGSVASNFTGIQVLTASNTIGGTTAGAGNVISGVNTGIVVAGAGSTANQVQGNLIGTNAAGTGAIINGTTGVSISGVGNTIGGSATGAGNVISAFQFGITVAGTDHVIQQNRIGTNAAGSASLGNVQAGIQVNTGANNLIGGTTAAERNVISGTFFGDGIQLLNSSTGNQIYGNYIGTNAAGTGAIANGNNGILIDSGSSNNLIGGTVAGQSNIIANNTQDGVAIAGTGTGNQIQGNSIFNNGQLGIDLGNNGVTANDVGDGDTGANGLQNFPVITGLTDGNISGTLNSTPSTTFRIHFFDNTAADGSGNGEGQRSRGFQDITTDGSGNATFNFGYAAEAGRPVVTATATSLSTGNTSEFSVAVNPLVVTNTNDSGLGSLRAAIAYANSVSGAQTITFNIPGAGPHTISPLTNLPDITGQVTIDATTQPGYAGTPLIALNGSLNGSPVDIGFNLRPGSDGSAFKGLVINNFDFAAFFVESNGNTFQGNYIGTNVAGTVDQGNGGGFSISGNNNIIGGAGANEGNLISGNGYGISLVGNGNTIQGNLIGTDVTGLVGLGNTFEGIALTLSTGNTIGGTTAAARNVIAANGDDAISLITQSNGNFIQGNYIGVGTDGATALGNGNRGIYLQESSSNEITDNVISNSATNGIELFGPSNLSDNNIIQGNFIGTDAAGTLDLGNTGAGILLRGGADNNTIGGTTAAARNIISGNDTNGITITNGATSNTILGNYIGTNAAGTADLGNSLNGVSIEDAGNNLVGGSTSGSRNVISGNNQIGVNIAGATAINNTVIGNYIGTNAAGTGAIANGSGNVTDAGVYIIDAINNTIGGFSSDERNVVSGNNGTGIILSDGATENSVRGNYIGTQVDGTSALGNSIGGIRIQNGAFENSIGGAITGAGNTIAFNTFEGIAIPSGVNNSILGNSIFSNTALGIDLGTDGVTANDADDVDGGANNLQNFPVLTAATVVGGNTTLAGTLNTTANTNIRIEIFSNDAADGSGNGEGQTFLTAITANTDGSGNYTINEVIAQDLTGKFITATVTNLNGDTSEFSGTIEALAGGDPLVVTNTNDSGVGSLRNAIAFANSNPGADVITFDTTSGSPFADATPDTISLTSGGFKIIDSVTLTGLGANLLTIQRDAGASDFRLFTIEGIGGSDITVTFEGLTLSGGRSIGAEGGYFGGGAIYNFEESVLIRNSALINNFSDNDGGAISSTGLLTIENSLIANNTADRGGGINIDSTSDDPPHTTVVSNSTISGNTATFEGGGIYTTYGSTQIRNSTITNNTGLDGSGSGVASSSNTTVEVVSSIIAGNTNSDVDVIGAFDSFFTSLGNNLIGTGNTEAIAAFTQPTDITGITDPGLNPLDDNGGPTQTHSLTDTSLARDTGSNPDGLTTDQRGAGFPRVSNGNIDIGAFEFFVNPLIVTNTNDSGAGSLRAAIDFANSNPGSDTITFDTASGVFADLTPDTILLTSGSFEIIESVTITGLGANLLTIQRDTLAPDFRLFTIDDGTASQITVDISGFTLSDGISDNGGAILNRENLVISDSVINNNTAVISGFDTGSGGAIWNEDGSLNILNSLITGNEAGDQGGAIWSNNGAINIQASQISNNTADGSGGGIFSNRGSLDILTSTISGNTGTFTFGDGGGIWHFGDGLGEDLTITASTLSGNSTGGSGGGLWTSTVLGDTSATILSSTISGNSADDRSGGIQNDNGLLTISNSTITNNTAPAGQGSGVGSFSGISSTRTEVLSSIIAGNVGSDIDVLFGSDSSFVSNGNNLIGTGEAVAIDSFNQPTDITGVTNPGLNPLANNGGPTQTHSLTDTSLARDAGNANGQTRDQRGFPRVIGSSADIGAFEADEVVDPLIVTNTNDSGAGSLRAAIDFANSNPGADSITFNIPTSDPGYNSVTGAYTINLLSELPFITETISIDGSSQPGFAGAPIIELNGATIGGSTFSGILSLGGADNSVIRGLVINNTPALAIQVSGGNGIVIAGNYIGTDVTGTVAQNGSSFGILLSGGSNTWIGGTTASDRNLISGNASGIAIGFASSTQIQGNYIGTDATGTVALGNGTGIDFYSGLFDTNNVVGGVVDGARNIISGNTNNGILFRGGAQGNQVLGNYIGLDANGIALGNGSNGIQLESGAINNTIGDTTFEGRNVISGNTGNGILITGGGTTNNTVIGNYIGTNAAGTGAIANDGNGIRISGNGNIIGGSTAGSGNVISGNGDQGIAILGNNNTVRGNIIGLDADGSTALGNLDDGILIANGSNNTIGGTTAGDRNVIGSNSNNGVSISGSSAIGNTVQGNYIGTAVDGTTARGNGIHGVSIGNSAANNSIGGTTAGSSNLIANNGADGVSVFGNTTTGNTVQGNSLFNNADLGIDLGNNGVTANDAGDGDTGANGLQNFPIITAATLSGGNTLLAGTFNSTANTNFRLEFFSNSTIDPSGNGEGGQFLGFANVTTDGSGNATFNPTFAIAVPLGQFVTATATNLTTNNTSEFAAARGVTATPTVTLGLAGSPLAENGGVATVTATLSNVSAQAVTVNLGFTGTATNVNDYTRSGTSIVIPAGSLTGSVTLTGVNDLLDEANETIIVDVLSVTNGTESGTQQVTATITDDDLPPVVSISPATIVQNEGNSGTTAYTYTVSLSAASGLPVTVNYTTNNGTATAGSDYVDNDGSLVFNPGGSLSQNITVLVNGDTTVEPTETFTVALNSATNGTLGTSTATGTITNDDVVPLPVVSISPVTLSQNEGNSGNTAFTFTVTLSSNPTSNVTVNYTTNNGTAIAGSDYTDNDNFLVFTPGGGLTRTVTVNAIGDTVLETNETFTVTLTGATGATIGTSTATATILNDEATANLSQLLSSGRAVAFNGVTSGDFAGGSVANAGDINGDGLDDLIIGARRADPGGRADAGSTYVVFGSTSGFPSLSALNGTNGFRVDGIASSDALGGYVSRAGDVDNDGFDDLIIGARSADPNGRSDSGQAYVLFGAASGFSSTVNPANLSPTSTSVPRGFRITGASTFDLAGASVSTAGDVDGDGFDDLLVGAIGGDPASTRQDAGFSYIVFGRARTSFTANINLATPTTGSVIRLNGIDATDASGYSVSNAGDINGDGRSDLIVGAINGDPNGSNSGETYVVFGSPSLKTPTGAQLNLSSLTGANGFRLNGGAASDNSGFAVSAIGDINGDTIDDLAVTAPFADPNGRSNSGAVYVVFGKTTGFSASLNLSSLNGTNGFKLNGIDIGDFAGVSVSAAGDFNRDGFKDLVIGASNGDPNGTDSGEVYVVYGRNGATNPFAANINLSTLNGSNGITLNGLAAGNLFGYSVASGNFNGGGDTDLLIGAPGSGAGAAYAVFGTTLS